MYLHNLSYATDTINVLAPSNITGATVSTSVDMQGWDGVEFILLGGVAGTNALLSAYATQSANSNQSVNTNINYANATLASLNIPQANVNASAARLDLFRMNTSRYVALVVVGAANGDLVSVSATRYRHTGVLPATDSAYQTVVVAQ